MIYEVRTYDIKGGSQAEVERRFGEAYENRKKFSELAAFFHTEIGPLNQIVHIWAYESLAERDERRGKMAADPAWQAWIKVSSQYFVNMENKVMKEAPFFRAKFSGPDEVGSR